MVIDRVKLFQTLVISFCQAGDVGLALLTLFKPALLGVLQHAATAHREQPFQKLIFGVHFHVFIIQRQVRADSLFIRSLRFLAVEAGRING